MWAVRKWIGRIFPGTTGVRTRRSEQRSAVEYIHFAIGLRSASQHHLICIDNGVAHDDRGARRSPIDGDTQRRRRRTGIAGGIVSGGGQAVRAVRQRRGRIAPRPAAIGHDAAQQGCAVEDLDRRVGFRRTGQRQRAVIGDVVAHRTAVGRERSDTRRRRSRRVDGHAQRG